VLTHQDNELLCRVGPGTPMGEVVRRFWVPAALTEELPENDGAPVRLRIFGEDLVAFRQTDGTVGLVANACPHRGASMFFGRNEENGLRCVYHGWKFDTEGNCTDMPNEPAESNFKHKIRIASYPAEEQGGVVWAYMGPADKKPRLPQMEWMLVPDSHRVISKCHQACNWVQAVEGGIDSSHISFLHSTLNMEQRAQRGGPTAMYTVRDRHPRFETVETDYGLMIAARRNAEEDSYYWRVTQCLMPWYTMIPGSTDLGQSIGGHAWIPIDDENNWRWSFNWRSSGPYTEAEVHTMKHNGTIHAEKLPGSYMPLRNMANDYMVDREKQRKETYSGIFGIGEQDTACQETMGHIYDRTKEHLGSADTAIIAYRRILQRMLRDLAAGVEPQSASAAESFRVLSTSVVLPRDRQWVESIQDRIKATSKYMPV